MIFFQKKTHLQESNRATDFLLSTQQFSRMLTRERMRADRSGCTLSLLKLDFFNHRELLSQNLTEVKSLLQKRLRLTDHCSILDGQSLGVILPETEESGALKLADDLVALMTSNGQPLSYAVYVYKGSKIVRTLGDEQESQTDTQQEDHSDSDDDHYDDSNGNGYRLNGATTISNPGNEDSSKLEHPVAMVQPMESLLVAPIPIWKRMLDIVGASAGLLLTAPVLAVTAVLIKATSAGPVLFTQKRDGIGGRPFTIYKLRTMTTDAEAQKTSLRKHSEQDGPAFKIKHDPRITPIGRILRKTSIDELPQLWNVLIGDMSLVGPRPLPCNESQACASWQRRRLEVTPGLTCIWQVHGRSKVSFVDWVRMDLEYIRSRSARLDLKLLLQTVPAVLFQKGAQ